MHPKAQSTPFHLSLPVPERHVGCGWVAPLVVAIPSSIRSSDPRTDKAIDPPHSWSCLCGHRPAEMEVASARKGSAPMRHVKAKVSRTGGEVWRDGWADGRLHERGSHVHECWCIPAHVWMGRTRRAKSPRRTREGGGFESEASSKGDRQKRPRHWTSRWTALLCCSPPRRAMRYLRPRPGKRNRSRCLLTSRAWFRASPHRSPFACDGRSETGAGVPS